MADFTVFDGMYQLIREVDSTYFGAATAGSTTSATDTRTGRVDDFFNNGTFFHVGQKLSRRITDFVSSTGVFTIDALPQAVAAADVFAAANGKFPRWALIQSLNMGLRAIGPVEQYTTLSVTGDQEYTVAAKIVRVEVSGETSDPYDWVPHSRWQQVEYSSDDRRLVFDPGMQPEAGATVRYWYLDYVSELSTSNEATVIPPVINPDLLVAQAAVHAWRWRMQQVRRDEEPDLGKHLERAEIKASIMGARYPISRPALIKPGRW